MIDKNELQKMRKIEIPQIDKNELIEIETVAVDFLSEPMTKFSNFTKQIKNPYCFKCGDYSVRIVFNADGDKLDTLLEQYLIRSKE